MIEGEIVKAKIMETPDGRLTLQNIRVTTMLYLPLVESFLTHAYGENCKDMRYCLSNIKLLQHHLFWQ